MEKTDIMQIAYDHDADVLYLSVGEPRRAISREVGDDIVLRIDPDNGAIVGLTIINLSTRTRFEDLPVRVDLSPVGAA